MMNDAVRGRPADSAALLERGATDHAGAARAARSACSGNRAGSRATSSAGAAQMEQALARLRATGGRGGRVAVMLHPPRDRRADGGRISRARGACSRRAWRCAVASPNPKLEADAVGEARLGRAMARETPSARSSCSRRARSSASRSASPGCRRARSSTSPSSRTSSAGRTSTSRGAGARGAPTSSASWSTAGRASTASACSSDSPRRAATSQRAGRLWGAIEAEERPRVRSGLGAETATQYAAAILASRRPGVRARPAQQVARLSLDEAVDYALAGRNTAAPTSR